MNSRSLVSAAVIYAGGAPDSRAAASARGLVASLAVAGVAVRRIDVDALPAIALEQGLPSERVASTYAKVAESDFLVVVADRAGRGRERVDAYFRSIPTDALAGKPIVPLRAFAREAAPARRAAAPAAADAACLEDAMHEALLAC